MNNLRKLKRAIETQKQQRDAAKFREIVWRESVERQQQAERARFAAQHPVSCGLVPLVEYQEPQWRYEQ